MTLPHFASAATVRALLRATGLMLSRRSRQLRADVRAGMTVLIAALFPILIMMSAIGADAIRLFTEASVINHSTELAALAAANKLSTYYTTSSTATLTSAANTIFSANALGTWHGTPSAAVATGSWGSSAFTAGGSTPNAVQVTGTATVDTLFGGFLGHPSFAITKRAVAKIGGARTVNVVVVNDASSSFSSDITQQRAADVAILNCIAASSKATSKFGIVTFNGTSTTYMPMSTITSSNQATLTSSINAMLSCTSSGGTGNNPPKCSGSNAAAGIYLARGMIADLNCPNCVNNIVVITDGVPSYNSSVSYTQSTGTYVTTSGTGSSMIGTGAATTPSCGVGSTNNCGSPTNGNGDPVRMLAMAQGQAAAAGASGILVSTIYYTGDTSTSALITAYTNELAGWTKNGGVAMVAPTAAQITSSSNGVCALLGVGLAQASL